MVRAESMQETREAAGEAAGAAVRTESADADRVFLLGLGFDNTTERGCIERILGALDEGRGGWMVTPNLDILRRWTKSARFRELVAKADVVVADGMPLIWASRIQGTPLPERVAGSSLVSTLSAAAAERGKSIFLLGGDPGAAEEAAGVLKERHPGVRIVGTHCPPMGFERDEAAMEAIEAALREAKPDIVYVALGSPKQEELILRLRTLHPGAWWLGVGISLSFLAGRVRRAPRWMQRLGLEWIHRLAQEPRRLAKRYLVHGLPFAAKLLGAAVWMRLRGRGAAEEHRS